MGNKMPDVCHAWDTDRYTEADAGFVKWLASEKIGIKAGLTALTARSKIGSVGWSAMETSRKNGALTVNDGKFGDLLHQTVGAVKNVVWDRVSGLTIRADCELPILKAAVEIRNRTYNRLREQENGKEAKTEEEKRRRPLEKPILFGLAELSSTNGISPSELENKILRLAENAARGGLDGMVVPGRFLAKLKREFPHLYTLVVGIRPEWLKVWDDDQRYAISHLEAAALGADIEVIGRPISEAKDPREVAARIMGELRAWAG